MSERINPRGNPAPQSDPGTESPSMMSAYAPPEYFAERNMKPRSDPWEEQRRMTEVYAPPELMRPAADARQNPSAQRLYPQRYEQNRPDPAPRVPDGEPCFAPVYAAPPVPGPDEPRTAPVYAAPPIPGPDEPRTAPVYAAPPIPGPNEPRRTPVPAAPSPSKPKKGLFERLFGRRKKL